MSDPRDDEDNDSNGIFPRDVFPEDAFPEDVFPTDIFPRGDEENDNKEEF